MRTSKLQMLQASSEELSSLTSSIGGSIGAVDHGDHDHSSNYSVVGDLSPLFVRLLHHNLPSREELQSVSVDVAPDRSQFSVEETALLDFMLNHPREKNWINLGQHSRGKRSWVAFQNRWKLNVKTLIIKAQQEELTFDTSAFYLRSGDKLKEKYKYLEKTKKKSTKKSK